MNELKYKEEVQKSFDTNSDIIQFQDYTTKKT